MEYKWYIGNLITNSSDGVVYEVEYLFETAFSGSAGKKWGTVKISGSASDSGFIAYNDLTHDNVLGFITGSFDIAALQSEVSSSLNKLLTSQSIDGTPW
tara:strand:+ start:464 stop:760 length:297 start_codon:yes stop_codon:yes gene_type:complete